MNNSQANEVAEAIGGLTAGDTFTDANPNASHNGHTDVWTVGPSGSVTKDHMPSDGAKAIGRLAVRGAGL
jgi:hypothetical protein